MSIEDVQKINQMAQNLLDQKMVETREEAVKEAQRLLNKEIVDRKEINEVQLQRRILNIIRI